MTSQERSVILVTGAASGIGLAFTEYYLTKTSAVVIAVDVNEICILNPAPTDMVRLYQHKVDFSSEESIQELICTIKHMLENLRTSGSNPKLDLVIHSAGVRGLVPSVEKANPEDVAIAETLQVMNAETLMGAYRVNTVGTFMLLQSLALAGLYHPPQPSPQESFTSSISDSAKVPTVTKVIIMASRMGSLTHARNTQVGGAYAYRASKAALNAIVTSISIDIPYVCFVLVHPGRVETGLTLCREEGAIEVQDSVKDMLQLIEILGRKDSGRFIDRFGGDIAW